MSGLLDITTATLKRDLGLEVHEIYVVIAKQEVLGTSRDEIREMLGASHEDFDEIVEGEDYKRVKMYIAGRQAEQQANQASGWDQIEALAVTKLAERLKFEKDPEFLLKAAAVANRAQRRASQQQTGILDPSTQGSKTVITLTTRLMQRLNGGASAETTEQRQLSISDGSMANPSFDEVNNMLSVSHKPILSREVEIKTSTSDPTAEEMLKLLK